MNIRLSRGFCFRRETPGDKTKYPQKGEFPLIRASLHPDVTQQTFHRELQGIGRTEAGPSDALAALLAYYLAQLIDTVGVPVCSDASPHGRDHRPLAHALTLPHHSLAGQTPPRQVLIN